MLRTGRTRVSISFGAYKQKKKIVDENEWKKWKKENKNKNGRCLFIWNNYYREMCVRYKPSPDGALWILTGVRQPRLRKRRSAAADRTLPPPPPPSFIRLLRGPMSSPAARSLAVARDTIGGLWATGIMATGNGRAFISDLLSNGRVHSHRRRRRRRRAFPADDHHRSGGDGRP